MQPTIYEKQLIIPYYLSDRFQKITLPNLLNVLVEISGEQTAAIRAVPASELGLSWVIIQYDLDVKRLPHAEERVRVKTFAKEYNRIFSYREFEVYDAEDNLLIYVMTVFALIDTERKLARIPKELIKGYGSKENRRIKRMPKPVPPKNLQEAKRKNFQVGYFDIDTNFHANNAMYFVWMFEALGDEFLATHRPVAGNVVFEKEVHAGDRVASYTETMTDQQDQLISRHQIQVENLVKCTGTFTWEKNEPTY